MQNKFQAYIWSQYHIQLGSNIRLDKVLLLHLLRKLHQQDKLKEERTIQLLCRACLMDRLNNLLKRLLQALVHMFLLDIKLEWLFLLDSSFQLGTYIQKDYL